MQSRRNGCQKFNNKNISVLVYVVSFSFVVRQTVLGQTSIPISLYWNMEIWRIVNRRNLTPSQAILAFYTLLMEQRAKPRLFNIHMFLAHTVTLYQPQNNLLLEPCADLLVLKNGFPMLGLVACEAS